MAKGTASRASPWRLLHGASARTLSGRHTTVEKRAPRFSAVPGAHARTPTACGTHPRPWE
eukprot:1214503-Prymnesium_polylepis.2